MSNSLNFYELLGVSKNASNEEIKAAYKKQMKFWHPDINKSSNAIDMSSKINEAKETLLDPIKRKDYDYYLEQKIKESYQRYTNTKRGATHTENDNKDNTVGKWEYFNEWLKHANVSFIRKLFGTICVLLESAFCFILRMLIIIIAFTCNILSVLIRTFFYYLAPIIGLILIFLVISIASNGLANTFSENKELTTSILIFSIIFISSFILPLLSDLLLSAKTFNYIYCTIDIELFKLSIGYKN